MPLTAQEYLTAMDDNPWIRDFADSWILDRDTGGGDQKVSDMELSLFTGNSPDAWLSAIVAIAKKTEDRQHDASLAAGMLEDFLGQHGEEYIDLISEIARKWPRFRLLLGGVWKGRMKKGVWHKVEAMRGAPW